jgi:hypothetical protein
MSFGRNEFKYEMNVIRIKQWTTPKPFSKTIAADDKHRRCHYLRLLSRPETVEELKNMFQLLIVPCQSRDNNEQLDID